MGNSGSSKASSIQPSSNVTQFQPEKVAQSGFWNSVIHIFTIYENNNGTTEHHISNKAVGFLFIFLLICLGKLKKHP